MKRFVILALTLLFLLSHEYAEAQCVMCKAVAEDSATSGGVGRGINSGIMYLMGIPYVLLITLYFAFFRKKANFRR